MMGNHGKQTTIWDTREPATGRLTSSSAIRQAATNICAAGILLAAICGVELVSVPMASAQAGNVPAAPHANRKQEQAHKAAGIAPVTTTVVVQAQAGDTYLPERVQVGTLDGSPLLTTPVSATVVTRELMQDQFNRVLSDVVKNDASIGEDYAPVGYYGDFAIRGFPIDLATGLEINGLTVAGEQDVPLANKERVEFLKGIAGVESGVTTAGGLINYVTERPRSVRQLELDTDQRGSEIGDLELGWLLGRRRQFGTLFHFLGEGIHSYVNDANGVLGGATFDGDWKLTDRTTLSGDFEYQHLVQHSVAGYQLLGGAVVPYHVYPSTMLGQQPWSKPNTFDTLNTNVRMESEYGRQGWRRNWRGFAAASFSQSLIDDNVIYPYGCYYEAVCNQGPGGPPPYFFAPDGTYDIYDYRDPGERRRDAVAEAVALGELSTGKVRHHLAAGGELFLRSVNLPGPPSAGAPSTVQNGAVYAYIGSENIFRNNIVYPDSTADLSAGPVVLWEDDHQSSLLLQDRMELPGHIQLIAGGRFTSLRDHNYGQPNSAGTATGELVTNKLLWLPQNAVTWNPRADLTLYGNYSVMLSLGPQGPFWAGGYYLPPFFTRQAEGGVKYQWRNRMLITADIFHMRAPFFYPQVIDTAGDQSFLSAGHETHDGVEAGAQGVVNNWLRLSATAAGIRAVSNGSLTPSFNGKQVINQPRLRTDIFADIAVPQKWALHWKGLHLMPGWSLTTRKYATRDDQVSVGGYSLFNLGARYMPGGDNGRMIFRIYADNILDKRYWKDTGANYGDTFVHLGAPTTVRLSAVYRF